MVTIETPKINLSTSERIVLQALQESIRKDLEGMECPHCKGRSSVVIKLDKKKLTSLSTSVSACCEEFRREIRRALAADVEALR